FRNVRVYAAGPGGERLLAIPSALLREELAVRELPTQGALRGLARDLAGEAPGAEALRAEVWQGEFDHALRPSRRKLADAVWRRPPWALPSPLPCASRWRPRRSIRRSSGGSGCRC